MPNSQWAGPDSALCRYIEAEVQNTLGAYRSQPNLVAEHAEQEGNTAKGGYSNRQLFELIQNSADALSLSENKGDHRIEIRLTRKYLYCADNGMPIDEEGVRALLHAHLSPKRGTAEIGRFGLGFKSVLGVTDAPEFFARTGSFRFDRRRARYEIQKIAPNAQRWPVLRLAFLVNLRQEFKKDRMLRKLRDGGASNIVRLRLQEGAYEKMSKQIEEFPSEFLLFVKHVESIIFKKFEKGNSESRSSFSAANQSGKYVITECHSDKKRKSTRTWKRFFRMHKLSSDALSDRRSTDDSEEVPIQWAVPLDGPNQIWHFWAFFPTMTASLVAGILNAPWKTNEDRQNLLDGPYNDELIETAAALIVDSLPELARKEDPARHLDALPRRQEAGDSQHSDRLRDRLYEKLSDAEVVPDQNGVLRVAASLKYPPRGVGPDARAIWSEYPHRPSDWLHDKAVTRTRLAVIDRLFPSGWLGRSGARRAEISEWLSALRESCGDDAVGASRAALRIAAICPEKRPESFGPIVLMADGRWHRLDPQKIVLPDPNANEDLASENSVHPLLVSDSEAHSALRKLGVEEASTEIKFRLLLDKISNNEPDDELFNAFWQISREIDPDIAFSIVVSKEPGGDVWAYKSKWKYWNKIRARSQSGDWMPLSSLLFPGYITDGEKEDQKAVVNMSFHNYDLQFLKKLGVTDQPRDQYDISREAGFYEFTKKSANQFYEFLKPGNSRPYINYLTFRQNIGCGPLQVLSYLSEKAKSDYSIALLHIDEIYQTWTMKHCTRPRKYPTVPYHSPAIEALKKHGRILTPVGIVPFADAIGNPPKNPLATRALLAHPKADRIKETFGLVDLTARSFGEPEVVDEEEPAPLLDEWPGLEDYLGEEEKNAQLIRCRRVHAGGVEWECFPYGSSLYLVRGVEEGRTLRLIAKELKLSLSEEQINLILRRETPSETRSRRAAVRNEISYAARLLKAVGEARLRSKLPDSLLAILESQSDPLTGVQVAEAAIATFHTDSLRQYREYLQHLDPPHQWAGSKRAVRFVEALGFPVEWAGEKSRRRDPFMEVDGPLTLPKLHLYQRRIVANVRRLLRFGSRDQRRGMISMPTGSGKTRVAVQAVIEALREGELAGGVLWVADRDELCEQAVEAWSQVWASKGARRERLRISRLWQGQPDPLRTPDRHVVVASVQTLASRIERRPDDYAFLADFALVVFDEAHRSIAPTYTGVMRELGMAGRRRRPDEPFLIGLTATPYRGYNQEETDWLVRRYGSRRLDEGAFKSDDPHKVVAELQQMQVLAEADQEEIDGGNLNLSDEELGQMDGVPWLPQSAENRIARDSQRTMRIVEAFETHIESDWPTLIFATSVEHAQTLAAILSGRGVTARAVSGATENRVRRRIVEEFRNGEIHALVNYGVFREGFDAPKTRAIIVARPVYSPNLYFQMIGRGLRGTANGGNDRCLIFNVRDNIENYDRQLAFSELDWLWR